MSIQTALSVGEPLKNLETSELKEFVALMPKIMSTTPPTSSARGTILFIMTPQGFVISRPEPWSSFPPLTLPGVRR